MPDMQTSDFKQRSVIALKDVSLQSALGRARGGFVDKRAKALAEVPQFERMRDEAARIKDHVLDHLDFYLEHYAEQVERSGGKVHFARDAAEAQRIVLDICKQADARTINKGKSMVSEEIGLNDALAASGYEVVETDLGEYIIQLAQQKPSHIIAPAVHLTREQVSEIFHQHHAKYGLNQRLSEVAELVDEARSVLREKFFRADVGITGANFLIAATGSSVIVTNEGNGDLTQTLARVHIVTAGIERIVPTLEDASLFLRLLARSATGQDSETYTTFSTGPRRADDVDGPQAYHVVLVDNGRSKMLAGKYRSMLRCIRCGACMNHCPVYGAVGGHAYGWVYPGPMGAVLSPLFQGLEQHYDLPNACTLNGRCQSVCPVKIPLTEFLRELRHDQFARKLTPVRQRWLLKTWAWFALHPRLYHWAERLSVRLLRRLARHKKSLRTLPLRALSSAWTDVRDMPGPSGKTFLEQWQQQQKKARP